MNSSSSWLHFPHTSYKYVFLWKHHNLSYCWVLFKCIWENICHNWHFDSCHLGSWQHWYRTSPSMLWEMGWYYKTLHLESISHYNCKGSNVEYCKYRQILIPTIFCIYSTKRPKRTIILMINVSTRYLRSYYHYFSHI